MGEFGHEDFEVRAGKSYLSGLKGARCVSLVMQSSVYGVHIMKEWAPLRYPLMCICVPRHSCPTGIPWAQYNDKYKF